MVGFTTFRDHLSVDIQAPQPGRPRRRSATYPLVAAADS
jgi:hypothetical protein